MATSKKKPSMTNKKLQVLKSMINFKQHKGLLGQARWISSGSEGKE